MKADALGIEATRELRFIPNQVDAFLKEAEACIEVGAKRIAVHPPSPMANEILSALAESYEDVEVFLQDASSENAEENCNSMADVTLLCHANADELSCALMGCLNLEHGVVVASITERYFKNMPLFLISIPKAGTHVLYKLVEAFGYTAGVELGDHARPGSWYCIEHSNSHTSARDFFVDTVRQSPLGNRHHPFMRSPAVFVYRNPLDVLVSEANYYHQDGNTAFAGYLRDLSFEERLLRLIDDPWLLGTIRDRIGNFAAWLDFQNVIPVSFEEIIGSKGGGNDGLQEEVVWTLQLKLHVPGKTSEFCRQIFDKDSPTFSSGQIGGYIEHFTPDIFARFKEINQDFMRIFGYSKTDLKSAIRVPGRSQEFRERSLRLSRKGYDNLPIAVEYNYSNHNLVRYKNIFFAMPVNIGELDMQGLSDEELKRFMQSESLSELKRLVFVKASHIDEVIELIPKFMERLARNEEAQTDVGERLALIESNEIATNGHIGDDNKQLLILSKKLKSPKSMLRWLLTGKVKKS